MGKRARRRNKAKSNAIAPVSAEPVHALDEHSDQADKTWALTAVMSCFFLSGFAALLYQTAWFRQFSIVFGTSELAVATVLAAYMAGLAGGATIAARHVDRVTRPVLVYGFLESAIAVSALIVPWLLLGAGTLYSIMLGDLSAPPDANGIGQSLFYLVVAFLVLALPTGFMGATLPLLTRHIVRSNTHLGPRVAMLYATNTFGAVLGVLAAGFVLIPSLGLSATVWVGVAINLVVFGIAALLARQLQPQSSETTVSSQGRIPVGFVNSCIAPWFSSSISKSQKIAKVLSEQAAWVLPIILLSGANTFYYEVLWTRLINHVLGGSIYAFATMLASFLSGIAIGGAISSRFVNTRAQASGTFALVQVCIAFLSMATYSWMEQAIPATRGLGTDAVFAATVMLPATIFIGATFPLAVRILSTDEHDASTCTARVYSWNTLGAIIGAVIAGFYLIPLLGFQGSIKLAVVINLLLGLWTLIAVAPRRPGHIGLVSIISLCVISLYQPGRPVAVLNASRFDNGDDTHSREEIYFAVGRSATVLMSSENGWMELRTNGLSEAVIEARGAPPTRQNQRWLTALPVAARPDAESLLVIGFGGGVALEGAPESVKEIDVIELEPEVIKANREVSAYRLRDPLADKRVRVIINDARNALRLSSKHYDIIVSQPSHPWTAGASHLYTHEFMSLAKSRLHDGGVFVQWMNTEFVDRELLQALSATLLDVFSNVRVYQPNPGALFFLASDSKLQVEHEIVAESSVLKSHPLHYSRLGLNNVEDFIVSLALDEQGLRKFAEGGLISTDDFNLMATQSRSRGDGLGAVELFSLFAPDDPLLNTKSWVYRDLGVDLNLAYIGSRLLHNGFLLRANKLKNSVEDRSTALLLQAIILSYQGRNEEAREHIRASIRERPSNTQARFLMLKNRLASLAKGLASNESSAVAKSLEGAPASVVKGWEYAAAQDWLSLVKLEDELAASETSDLWYPEASQLRVEWRTKLTAPGMEKQVASEALAIVDRAILIAPALDLYVLRAVVGLLLKDPSIFVESCRYVASYIELKLEHTENGDYKLSTHERAVMQSRIKELGRKLDSDFIKPVKQRAFETRYRMKRLTEKLQSIQPRS